MSNSLKPTKFSTGASLEKQKCHDEKLFSGGAYESKEKYRKCFVVQRYIPRYLNFLFFCATTYGRYLGTCTY
jgi:hypothetical protein